MDGASTADAAFEPGDGAVGWRPARLGTILRPKVWSARRRMGGEGSGARLLVLGLLGFVFWALLYTIIYRMLIYFRAAAGIGDILATKLLGLVLLTFLSILLLSNIITALSSFFLARDLELLRAAPVDRVRVYIGRLIESLTHSSWMVVIVLAPMLFAYGWVYRGGAAYAGIALATMAALLVLPAVVGAALTLLLVNVFPARRARDLLALLALFGAAAVILLVRLLRPEQLADPEGFRDLVDFVAALETPQSVWLPSEWAANALMAPLRAGGLDLFPLGLLASTAAAFVVLGAWLHGRLYPEGYSRAQEGSELRVRTSAPPRIERLLRGAATSSRALVGKDVRTFFRDTTQWSQLILLGVLVVVYVYNVRVLPLWTGEEVGFFLVNVISFLNLGLAGFVLAAIAARFLFPAVSLEGKTLWLLRSSPLDLRKLIWTKYWVGVVPLLVIALALTVGTNLILRVGPFMMALSIATITLVTFAVGALAIGFGAAFPRFDTENTAQIPTGFGGFLFMMTATVYLALVIALEAWPVYGYLNARLRGVSMLDAGVGGLVLGIGAALALSIVAIVVPLRSAVARVGELET
ncbi:MAG: putative ABC transporter permease subunit [Longimicrobiales bacterium]